MDVSIIICIQLHIIVTISRFSFFLNSAPGIGHGVKRVWGKGGYRKDTGIETTPIATPTAVREQAERVEATPSEPTDVEEDTYPTTTAVSRQSQFAFIELACVPLKRY